MAEENFKSSTDQKWQFPQLELKGISKYFGVTRAINNMDFAISKGEIVGLVGPNGAGKTTLMKIMTGVYAPSVGSIRIDDKEIPTENYDIKLARAHGVACVYQELSLCDNLNVFENFMAVHHRRFNNRKWRNNARQFAEEALKMIFPDYDIDVSRNIEDFALGQQQMVEIARAISFDGLRVLILDEPTSSLTFDRIEQLHAAIRRLSSQGVSIIYVSHKLEEIKQITNRIVVMKNGECVQNVSSADISTVELIKHLGGNTAIGIQTRQNDKQNTVPVITVTDLVTKQLSHINMEVRQGEIIGLAGLGGSGQKALLHEIFRAGRKKRDGGIYLEKRACFISGDRQCEGIFRLWSIYDNILVSGLNQVSKWGLINLKNADSLVSEWFQKLKFKAESEHAPITSLSGGNQQKALIARGIASQADVILLDDPTRGVDIETKQEIYRLLREAKENGKTIVWNSTEDVEMELCDRVYVMRSGAIVQELVGDSISVGNIVKASFEDKKKAEVKASNNLKSLAIDNLQGKGSLSRFFKLASTNRSMIPLVTFVVILALNAFFNINSVSYRGIDFLFGAAVPLVFIALGQMFITLAGDIDMGIGAAVGLINVLIATKMVQSPISGLIWCILFVLGYAAMGALIHVRRIPAIIVTLGASFVWLGIALLIQPIPGGASPEWLTKFYNFSVPFVPLPIFICCAAAMITFWFVKRSRYGVILRGIGNNPEAISNAGWSYFWARVTLYSTAGVCVVMAGMALTAICNGSDANATASFTLNSVATIVLGGCEFSGGIGEPVGVVGGALAISLISSLLAFLSVSTNFQSSVVGCILVAALTVRSLRKRVNSYED
jgi:ribose transport system ATP-binding protein